MMNPPGRPAWAPPERMTWMVVLGVLRYPGQAVELASHDLGTADGAVPDALAGDAPELGRTRSVRIGLPGQAGGYLLVQVLQVPVGAGGQDRAGILFGLQQAGDDERLVPAQDRGPGLDACPLLEPAAQALLVALVQVIPQARQRAAGVQLGYRVHAGREVLGGRPLPRLDLADHVVRHVGPGGQVLLGQACPGPVEAQLRAEHGRGRPGSAGIVRHLFGIHGEGGPGAGDQWASGPIPFLAVALARQAVKHESGHRERDSDHDSRGGWHPPSQRNLPR